MSLSAVRRLHEALERIGRVEARLAAIEAGMATPPENAFTELKDWDGGVRESLIEELRCVVRDAAAACLVRQPRTYFAVARALARPESLEGENIVVLETARSVRARAVLITEVVREGDLAWRLKRAGIETLGELVHRSAAELAGLGLTTWEIGRLDAICASVDLQLAPLLVERVA